MAHELTYEIVEDTHEVLIKNAGVVIISQPHHPSAENNATWENEQAAIDWAEETIAELIAIAETPGELVEDEIVEEEAPAETPTEE